MHRGHFSPRGRRRGDPVDGVLLLDKPAGMTSNDALQRAKRLLAAAKAGHTGSLDPIATGVLPLTFGEATKISQFLLDADKRYWVDIRLGISTRTFDSEGEVTSTRPVTVSRRDVDRALSNLSGEIEQLPPMYSAIKRDGTPLYELARQGVEVEREKRRIWIRDIRVESFEGDRLTMEVACSKGTYIRTLAHDLGELLGCGGHVVGLRRLAVGALEARRAVTLAALEALATPEERRRHLMAPGAALEFMPEVQLTRLAAHYLRQGQPVSVPHRHPPDTWLRLFEEGGAFLGMGQVAEDGLVAPRRLLNLTPRP